MHCQGHLAGVGKKNGTFKCNRFLEHMKKVDPENNFSDIVMFNGASNVQLGAKLLKL